MRQIVVVFVEDTIVGMGEVGVDSDQKNEN
jgi:hypothetical protein